MAKKGAKKERSDREPQRKRGRRRARSQRTTILLRWCFVGVVVFVGFLYYRPLTTYFETREAVARRADEVRALARQRQVLEQRLAAQASLASLVRDAR